MRSLDNACTVIAITLAVALALALAGTVAQAQVAPYPLQARPGLTTGDIHRYEMDRLRSQADQSQALARSQSLQTQMTIQQLQARRQPPLTASEPARPLTLEEARQAREATQARSAAATRSMSQIDDWLDRRPQ